jgi:hypothetical protein
MNRGLISGRAKTDFWLVQVFHTDCAVYPHSCQMGTMGESFPGSEVLRNSLSANVRNAWSYTSNLSCVHGMVLD